ncbi:MAG: flavin reductase family protein [Candidatus Thorarchaeota archaeon]
MTKIKIDQRFSPYQMPSVIIGTIVNDRPNFMLCTWASRVNRNPPTWMVSINTKHYTMTGIRKNKVFSMNLPSANLIQLADYIGTNSGREIDKSSLFEIFYGETKAPMIMECVLNMELEVMQIIELPDHFVVLGTAVTSYVDDRNMTDNKPDLKKMNPVVYTGAEKQPTYWTLGEKIGDAFKLGKEFKGLKT